LSGTAEACLRLFGAAPVGQRRLHGGDLSEVTWLEFADGRNVVAKRGPRVAVEARMLGAMAAAGAPVPGVLGLAGDVLFLEALPETAPEAAGWEAAGAALARLHGCEGAGYGWGESYGFGRVEIDNRPAPDWPGFWAERRLLPLAGALPAALRRRVETLAGALNERLPRAPRAALLHGDLWQGNLLFAGARACFIDPACYYGHGEVDLAMLALFGRIPRAFAAGYGPEEAGAAQRRAIYQLGPALMHVALFGAAYHALVARLLDEAGV